MVGEPVPDTKMNTDSPTLAFEANTAEPSNARINLLGMSRPALEAYFLARGEKKFRSSQVLKWVHQRGVNDFAAMTDIGKTLRATLADSAELTAPEIVSEQLSDDGTRKWLLRVDERNAIETVYIPEDARGTLCISSQAGCALNCTFCSTAQQGFGRNLNTAEIVGQLWRARDSLGPDQALTNIVLMGMGEPLLNLDNVLPALELMVEDCAYGLAKRRVTLSTAGVVPGLVRLKQACPVSLAVSLHAPEDALRDRLVPLNRTYPIATLLRACWDYLDADSRRQVTFEYVMLDGVNDHLAHARKLAKLLRGKPAKVNLIPFNPFPGTGFRRSNRAVIDRFRDVLMDAGVITITRKTRGDDIDAACGQLAGAVTPRSQGAIAHRSKLAISAAVPVVRVPFRSHAAPRNRPSATAAKKSL